MESDLGYGGGRNEAHCVSVAAVAAVESLERKVAGQRGDRDSEDFVLGASSGSAESDGI